MTNKFLKTKAFTPFKKQYKIHREGAQLLPHSCTAMKSTENCLWKTVEQFVPLPIMYCAQTSSTYRAVHLRIILGIISFKSWNWPQKSNLKKGVLLLQVKLDGKNHFAHLLVGFGSVFLHLIQRNRQPF